MTITRIGWKRGDEDVALLTREWLVTNGLGGYGAGSLAGACTRRFHGLLVAALPTPLGRVMMLNHLAEQITLPNGSVSRMGGEERMGATELPDPSFLHEFRLEDGLPVWTFTNGTVTLEKRIVLPHLQNTVFVSYRVLASSGPVQLDLRPSVNFRAHEGLVSGEMVHRYALRVEGGRSEILGESAYPSLKMRIEGKTSQLVTDGGTVRNISYRVERARGYDHEGPLWSPGFFRLELAQGEEASLVASVESWETMEALAPSEARAAECERRRRLLYRVDEKARTGIVGELVLAADQFVITPQSRVDNAARAHASGDDARTVIAGYHWFTDWGRDTMISLEGLTLSTGRHSEAGYILRTFARYIRDGLIPNMFPEGEKEGLYHTADATLWFFQALGRYVEITGDTETRRLLLRPMMKIIDHHIQGTHFGIHVDPTDGLLAQGAPGYQLTWMDAKVGDWVVTPRRGKAVEINALFYNALRLLEGWIAAESGVEASRATGLIADRVRASFNARFWNAEKSCLFDVVDTEGGGNDPALRPNQLFAISLTHPVLDSSRWEAVVNAVRNELVTPVGLRSLSPKDPSYKATYDGDLVARDAAYHQGTVWGWLIGAYVDAWLRVYPSDLPGARELLSGLERHMGQSCIGTLAEIADAEAPFTARGCVAQAWSVAEALRSFLKVTG
ncbi:MAG: amylo-alpha-1,6-glucosidase [Polyangiaceae bacterium]